MATEFTTGAPKNELEASIEALSTTGPVHIDDIVDYAMIKPELLVYLMNQIPQDLKPMVLKNDQLIDYLIKMRHPSVKRLLRQLGVPETQMERAAAARHSYQFSLINQMIIIVIEMIMIEEMLLEFEHERNIAEQALRGLERMNARKAHTYTADLSMVHLNPEPRAQVEQTQSEFEKTIEMMGNASLRLLKIKLALNSALAAVLVMDFASLEAIQVAQDELVTAHTADLVALMRLEPEDPRRAEVPEFVRYLEELPETEEIAAARAAGDDAEVERLLEEQLVEQVEEAMRNLGEDDARNMVRMEQRRPGLEERLMRSLEAIGGAAQLEAFAMAYDGEHEDDPESSFEYDRAFDPESSQSMAADEELILMREESDAERPLLREASYGEDYSDDSTFAADEDPFVTPSMAPVPPPPAPPAPEPIDITRAPGIWNDMKRHVANAAGFLRDILLMGAHKQRHSQLTTSDLISDINNPRLRQFRAEMAPLAAKEMSIKANIKRGYKALAGGTQVLAAHLQVRSNASVRVQGLLRQKLPNDALGYLKEVDEQIRPETQSEHSKRTSATMRMLNPFVMRPKSY